MLGPESIVCFSSTIDGVGYHGLLGTASMQFVTARVIALSVQEALLTIYLEQSKTGEGWDVVQQQSQVVTPGGVASLTVPVVGPEHVRTRLTIGQGSATASILANAVARHAQPVFRLRSSNMLSRASQLPASDDPSPWTTAS